MMVVVVAVGVVVMGAEAAVVLGLSLFQAAMTATGVCVVYLFFVFSFIMFSFPDTLCFCSLVTWRSWGPHSWTGCWQGRPQKPPHYDPGRVSGPVGGTSLYNMARAPSSENIKIYKILLSITQLRTV